MPNRQRVNRLHSPRNIPILNPRRTVNLTTVPSNDRGTNEVQRLVFRYLYQDVEFVAAIRSLLTGAGQLGDGSAPPDTDGKPAEPVAITVHVNTTNARAAREADPSMVVVDLFMEGFNSPDIDHDAVEYAVYCETCSGTGTTGVHLGDNQFEDCPACNGEGFRVARPDEIPHV